jgi:hypothetical protein
MIGTAMRATPLNLRVAPDAARLAMLGITGSLEGRQSHVGQSHVGQSYVG